MSKKISIGSVHHMIVAGCHEPPPKTKHNVWNCGSNGNPVLEPNYPSFVVLHYYLLSIPKFNKLKIKNTY